MAQRTNIVNPFLEKSAKDYQCFGCSPHNAGGLQMKFYVEDGCLFATWQPTKKFEGYTGVVHGGIQSTLMDEIASWFIYTLIGTAGVTKSMHVEYISPTRITSSPILLKAELKKQINNEVYLNVTLSSEDKITATAEVVYFVFPEAIARRRYNYPGKEAFYKSLL